MARAVCNDAFNFAERPDATARRFFAGGATTRRAARLIGARMMSASATGG
jgi:hypothetical protein